jgi:hypothetical protein
MGYTKIKIFRGNKKEQVLDNVAVDAKLICKHKGLIPDSNVKACQPI